MTHCTARHGTVSFRESCYTRVQSRNDRGTRGDLANTTRLNRRAARAGHLDTIKNSRQFQALVAITLIYTGNTLARPTFGRSAVCARTLPKAGEAARARPNRARHADDVSAVTAGDVKIVRVLLLLLLLLKTHMELLSDYSRGRFPAIDNAGAEFGILHVARTNGSARVR